MNLDYAVFQNQSNSRKKITTEINILLGIAFSLDKSHCFCKLYYWHLKYYLQNSFSITMYVEIHILKRLAQENTRNTLHQPGAQSHPKKQIQWKQPLWGANCKLPLSEKADWWTWNQKGQIKKSTHGSKVQQKIFSNHLDLVVTH